MNAASQLFRVLAIIGAIAAGALFYMTNGKVDALTSQLGKAKSELADAKTATAADLKTAQDTLATTAAELDKVKKVDLKKALDDEDLATKRLAGAIQALDDSEKESKAKDAKIADLSTQIADLKPKAESVDDLNKQISNLRTQVADLQTQLEEMRSKNPKPANGNATNGPTAAPTPVQLSAPASAKILQVDTKDWVLVLDAGSDSALQKDAHLYLKIGSTPIGTVDVLSNDGKLVTCSITGTDVMTSKDYSQIVKVGLSVSYQRAL